jgi:hypothetical protein
VHDEGQTDIDEQIAKSWQSYENMHICCNELAEGSKELEDLQEYAHMQQRERSNMSEALLRAGNKAEDFKKQVDQAEFKLGKAVSKLDEFEVRYCNDDFEMCGTRREEEHKKCHLYLLVIVCVSFPLAVNISFVHNRHQGLQRELDQTRERCENTQIELEKTRVEAATARAEASAAEISKTVAEDLRRQLLNLRQSMDLRQSKDSNVSEDSGFPFCIPRCSFRLFLLPFDSSTTARCFYVHPNHLLCATGTTATKRAAADARGLSSGSAKTSPQGPQVHISSHLGTSNVCLRLFSLTFN